MLSRIAESLFWLGRYIERAEDTARILDVNYHMLLEESQRSYRLRWEPLIIMAGEENRFRQLYDEANAENVFEFLAFRHDNPSSIVQCIAKARENARTIRDRISREMWEDINGLYHKMSSFRSQDEITAGPHRFCDEIKFGTHRFHGVTEIRPGTYVFNDRNTVDAEAANYADCAATVLTTVVSASVTGRAIIDAGSKTLTADSLESGEHRYHGHIQCRPDLILEGLSEEHGHLKITGTSSITVGERLRVIPNHICPCINLHDGAYIVSGENVVDQWKVAARGKVA